MDKIQLLDRISKKQEQIKKIEKRILKWSKDLTDKDLEMAKLPYTKENNSIIKDYKMFEYMEPSYDHYGCALDELRGANRDLMEANVTLAKYKNQLNLIIERDSIEKIPVLEEFFKRYKEQVVKYVVNNMSTLLEYFELDHKRMEYSNNKRIIMREENLDEDEWKINYNRLKSEAADLLENVHSLTRQVYSRKYDDNIDHDELNKILDKDIDTKYWNMINKVTKFTGEIIDASNVTIADDGNLNGIIIGNDGKAKLETILAGGYNQNVIVNVRKGQILHYRLIVNEVK